MRTKRAAFLLAVLLFSTVASAQTTIYWKKDYIRDASGAAVATATPAPSDTEAPSTPGTPTQSTVTTSSVTIAWSSSTDNGGSTLAAGYIIYRGAVPVGAVSSTNFTDLGLTANTSYTYRIVAFDNAHNYSSSRDAAGNVTYDGSHHYYYDAESRLIEINSSDVEYAYDHAGRRIKRKVGSVTTYYIYGLTGLMSEFSTSDSDSDAVEAASDDRLQYRVGEQTGTAVMLMDAGGVPRENNRVFPFGEPWLLSAGSKNTEKFTTYQHDNDAGSDLDYAMARYYASRMGRFMTADPGHVGANIGDPQSWNAYAYALNDPINLIDPSGKDACEDALKQEGLTPSPCSMTVTTTPPKEVWRGGGFDFGWWPSFEDWTKSLQARLGPQMASRQQLLSAGISDERRVRHR